MLYNFDYPQETEKYLLSKPASYTGKKSVNMGKIAGNHFAAYLKSKGYKVTCQHKTYSVWVFITL